MITALEIPIYANVIFFLGFISLRFKTRLRASALVFTWFILNLIYCLYMFVVIGGTNISAGYMGISISINMFPVIVLGILLIIVLVGSVQSKWSLLVLILASAGTLGRYVSGFALLSDRQGSDFDRFLVMFVFVIIFYFGVLITLPMLVDGKNRIYSKLFLVNLADIRANAGVLISGTLALTVTYSITHMFLWGEFVELFLAKQLHAFAMSSTLRIFYYSLLDQLICIGLAKYVLDSFFKEDETSMWEIVIYAGLYAGFHYYLHPALILREFVMGLVLSYMFLRTRSLTYGIVIYSLLRIFTEFT